ncbi:hypothetical protein T492DRAFT_885413 [Pavlovales sp. CCMP2436]|nr:hypothetical protein T492DRAFT_885413 [Pavlovales sp. CCMP2436]
MWIETRLLSSATWDRLEHAESVHSRELQQYNSNMRAWLSKQSAVVALSLSVRVCWLTLSGKELRAAVGTLDGSAPPYLRSAFVGIRSLSDAHAAFELRVLFPGQSSVPTLSQSKWTDAPKDWRNHESSADGSGDEEERTADEHPDGIADDDNLLADHSSDDGEDDVGAQPSEVAC